MRQSAKRKSLTFPLNDAGGLMPPEDEQELESYLQGLRRLVAYYRQKLTRAEHALAALEGKSSGGAKQRLNKVIKDMLAKAGVSKSREEIRAELMQMGLITDSITDRSRVDRSLRQCVNAQTLVEVRGGRFAAVKE